MNQLLASLALMTISLWAIKVQKAPKLGKALTLSPAFFLWITVIIVLIWYEIVVVPATIASGNITTGYVVGAIIAISLILNIMLLIDFLKGLKTKT